MSNNWQSVWIGFRVQYLAQSQYIKVSRNAFYVPLNAYLFTSISCKIINVFLFMKFTLSPRATWIMSLWTSLARILFRIGKKHFLIAKVAAWMLGTQFSVVSDPVLLTINTARHTLFHQHYAPMRQWQPLEKIRCRLIFVIPYSPVAYCRIYHQAYGRNATVSSWYLFTRW